MLRLGVTVSDCSPLENRTLQSNPELKAKFDKCNAWLGPNQPGNTTPDFTRTGSAQASRQEREERRLRAEPATKVGERRSAGQPDAGPVAGQRDLSKPQVALPPAVQELVDGLTKNTLPEQTKEQVGHRQGGPAPQRRGPQEHHAGAPPSPQQLLDFLLAP